MEYRKTWKQAKDISCMTMKAYIAYCTVHGSVKVWKLRVHDIVTVQYWQYQLNQSQCTMLVIQSEFANMALAICRLYLHFYSLARSAHWNDWRRIPFDSFPFLFLVFQFGYTTVFGAYSAFLFVRTGESKMTMSKIYCQNFLPVW